MVDFPKYCGPMVAWSKVMPMPEVVETLPKIAKRFHCVVVSNATDSNAELMKQAFQRVELDSYFLLFITSKELGASKPQQEFFEGVADKLCCQVNEMCMIGNDYDKDIVGAKGVGIKTVLLSKKNCEYPLADFVISSFGELVSILDKHT